MAPQTSHQTQCGQIKLLNLFKSGSHILTAEDYEKIQNVIQLLVTEKDLALRKNIVLIYLQRVSHHKSYAYDKLQLVNIYIQCSAI